MEIRQRWQELLKVDQLLSMQISRANEAAGAFQLPLNLNMKIR